MSLGKIVDKELQQDTQKDQNSFFTDKDGHTPGSEQTNHEHPFLVETNAGTHETDEVDPGYEGSQAGGTRAWNANRERMGHGLQDEQEAHEGTVTTRTPEGEKQGISNASSTEDSERQKKVVKDRPDAQAGVNHNKI